MMEKVMIELDEDEARLFIKLRRIAMKSGSVSLNYNKKGKVQSIDEYRHWELSTIKGLDKKTETAIL